MEAVREGRGGCVVRASPPAHLAPAHLAAGRWMPCVIFVWLTILPQRRAKDPRVSFPGFQSTFVSLLQSSVSLSAAINHTDSLTG